MGVKNIKNAAACVRKYPKLRRKLPTHDFFMGPVTASPSILLRPGGGPPPAVPPAQKVHYKMEKEWIFFMGPVPASSPVLITCGRGAPSGRATHSKGSLLYG